MMRIGEVGPEGAGDRQAASRSFLSRDWPCRVNRNPHARGRRAFPAVPYHPIRGRGARTSRHTAAHLITRQRIAALGRRPLTCVPSVPMLMSIFISFDMTMISSVAFTDSGTEETSTQVCLN